MAEATQQEAKKKPTSGWKTVPWAISGLLLLCSLLLPYYLSGYLSPAAQEDAAAKSQFQEQSADDRDYESRLSILQATDLVRKIAFNPENSQGRVKAPIERCFVNDIDKPIDLYWRDTQKNVDVKLETLAPGSTYTALTYYGHTFLLKEENSDKVIRSHTISEDYEGKMVGTVPKILSKFEKEYFLKTGRDWINFERKKPASYPIWSLKEVGEIEIVVLEGGNHSGPQENQKLSDFPEVITMISDVPKILYLDGFLTPDEADYIVNWAQEKSDIQKSRVSHDGKRLQFHESRTSSNAWLNCEDSPRLFDICRRSFKLMRIPFDDSNVSMICEGFQVIHYDQGQEYKPHYDYFSPKEFQSLAAHGNNRFATLFIYLNDVEAGGETVFPRTNGQYVRNACEDADGFRVKPKKGSALIFYSMLEDGNLDVYSVHGGCPVKSSEKWAANIWFWDERRNDVLVI